MINAPAPADDITLPAIQRAGPMLYELNASGTNLWSAQVQPGRTDDDQRLPDAECERIAAILADRASTSRAGEREQLIEALKDLAHHDTYQIEYDGRVELCCHSCGYMGQHEKHEDSCSYRAARGLLTQLLGAGWDEPPPPPPDPEERIPCAICSRRVARIGMRHHMKAKHGAAKQGATP